MGEFFHGWKRKVACVMLVMALVFTGGWIRSRHIVDSILIPAKHTDNRMISGPRGLGWMAYSPNNAKLLSNSGVRWTTEVVLTDGNRFALAVRDELDGRNVSWRWRWYGFDFGQCHGNRDEIERLTVFIVPYWSVTIPLTLISAFLLLAKPCKSPPQKNIEPIPAEGT